MLVGKLYLRNIKDELMCFEKRVLHLRLILLYSVECETLSIHYFCRFWWRFNIVFYNTTVAIGDRICVPGRPCDCWSVPVCSLSARCQVPGGGVTYGPIRAAIMLLLLWLVAVNHRPTLHQRARVSQRSQIRSQNRISQLSLLKMSKWFLPVGRTVLDIIPEWRVQCGVPHTVRL